MKLSKRSALDNHQPHKPTASEFRALGLTSVKPNERHNMKTDEEYLKKPNHCPHCDSDQTEGRGYDGDGNEIHQFIDCLDCEKTWTDVYVLSKVVIA